MHILDAIRLGGETNRKAQKLCEDYEYDPEKIGCAILKACGYEIRHDLKGGFAVRDADGKLLYYAESSYVE